MEHGGKGVLSYPLPSPAALDPPVEWDRLRRACPVAPITFPSGDAGSLLTRYDDVKQVLSDPRFTRALDAPDAARISADSSGGVFNSAMANVLPQSGAAHLHWRRQISKWFTVRRMNELRVRVEAMAESLVDDMVAKGSPADLKSNFGFPLPVWVICTMLGVPDTDRDRFAKWSDMVLAATGIGLLVAGHETTANMIGKMVAMLLADRERRWEPLLADPTLIRTAVEETLRMDANSGLGMVRYLPVETEVAGAVLPKGTTVLCSMAAANRDATVFDDAEELDITRSPNTHLSFGVGPHSCLGQALARTELQVVLEVLLRRLPTLELAVAPHKLGKLEGLIVGGLTEVPVRW